MWQRFTERARRVVFFAQEEAGRLGENYVSTEHLLLGLIREDDSVAARILLRLEVPLERIRSEVEQMVTRGDGRLGQDMQLTPRSKRCIDLAYDEARQLKNNYIGTEHLLLGLIREKEGMAGRVFAKLGVELDTVRSETRKLQDEKLRDKAKPEAADEAASGSGTSTEQTSDGKTLPFSRFTERARRIMYFAQEEAFRLGEAYVSTEHLLLGMVRENDSVAARILDRMGVSLGRIRSEIERQVSRGDARLSADIQLTPRVKRVIDLAYDEARQLSNNYIGTEHLLLGLIREGDGLAGRVLAKLGVELERSRREVMILQDNDRGVQLKPDSGQNAGRSPLQRLLDLIPNVMRRQNASTQETIRSTKAMLEIFDEQSGWRGKSLVSLKDITSREFKTVLDAAKLLKTLYIEREEIVYWTDPRTLAMIFEKPSLRTRVSFEAGMFHLGGHAIYLAPGDIGLGTREPVADVAAALSRWVNIISARVFRHETVEELAANATVPVINALSDREHPIQAFADLLTLQEQKGELGNSLKMAYIGDGNNVLHALLLACAKLGVHLSAACPDGYFPDEGYVAEAQRIGAETGAQITVVTDPSEAVKDADALYTDVWASMGQEEEKAVRAQVFAPYQINSDLVSKAKPDAIVLHCLPAHTGEEIAADVYEKHKTVIMDQAENRMHTQKALIALMIGI